MYTEEPRMSLVLFALTCTSESKPRLAIPRNVRGQFPSGPTTWPISTVRSRHPDEAACGDHRIKADPETADEIIAATTGQGGEEVSLLGADSRDAAGQPVAAQRDRRPAFLGRTFGQLGSMVDAAGEFAYDVSSAGAQRSDHLGKHPGAASATRLRMDDQQQRGHASSLPGFRMPAGSNRSFTARNTSTPRSPISADKPGGVVDSDCMVMGDRRSRLNDRDRRGTLGGVPLAHRVGCGCWSQDSEVERRARRIQVRDVTADQDRSGSGRARQ